MGLGKISICNKVLFWDIETSSIDIKYRTYDLSVKIKRFDADDIIRDYTILSIAYAWNDDDPKCISVSPSNPLNDYEIVRQFRDILNDSDYIVGHNMDAFDLKKFNTRAIMYGLDPVGQKNSIDTLKIARKYFKFTSNKLRYLAKHFGIGEKDESPDWDLCLEGDRDELSKMREYNKKDVIVTRELYKKLSPYHNTHPNMNVKSPVKDVAGRKVLSCKLCHSVNVIKDGNRFYKEGKKQAYQCKDCGHKFT